MGHVLVGVLVLVGVGLVHLLRGNLRGQVVVALLLVIVGLILFVIVEVVVVLIR